MGRTSWKSTSVADRPRDQRKYDDIGRKGEYKVTSLLSYRNAKGLCYKCGDKWGKCHICPAQVPLHIVEELMSAVHIEAEHPTPQEDCDSEEGLELMEMQEAQERHNKRIRKPTMRLLGWIGKQQTLILVDSGSAATFISTSLVDWCQLSVQDSVQSQYTAADGGKIVSTTIVPTLQWFCQGYTFYRDTKIIDLPIYDIILGADWLEEQGPMWIDWKKKIMKFQSGG
jgi:hypothetical protein